MCIVSWNEPQFPPYFFNFVCRINRIPRGKDLGGKRPRQAQIGVKLFKQLHEKLIVQLLHERKKVNHHVGARANTLTQLRRKPINYGWMLQLVMVNEIIYETKTAPSSEKQPCAATAYYYYYEAYLLKVGLILYCGIVCSYITWIGINKIEKERFSHTRRETQWVGHDVWPVNL